MQSQTNYHVEPIAIRQTEKPENPARAKSAGAFFAIFMQEMGQVEEKDKSNSDGVIQSKKSLKGVLPDFNPKQGHQPTKQITGRRHQIETEAARETSDKNSEQEIDTREAKSRLASRLNVQSEDIDIRIKTIRPEPQEKFLAELRSRDDVQTRPRMEKMLPAEPNETVAKQSVKLKSGESLVGESGKQSSVSAPQAETLIKPDMGQFDGQPFDTTTGFNEMPEQQHLKQDTVGRLALNKPQFSELLERVSDIMTRQAAAGKKLEIQLEIDTLGKLMVGADRLKDEIHLRIFVDNSDAKKWLEPHLRTLQQHLRQEGIDVEQLDVSLQQESPEKRTEHQKQHPAAAHLFDDSVNHEISEKGKAEQVYAQRRFGYNTLEVLA